MLFHTHLMLGISAFILFGDYFSGGNSILFFLLVILGSVLPDIDDGNSKIKKASGVLGSIISFLFKHRGIFHSLIFVLVMFIIVSFLNNYYAWAITIGYLSHLVGDAITPMGIKWFYPLSHWHLKGPIKVGSIGEWVILFGLVILVVKEMLF